MASWMSVEFEMVLHTLEKEAYSALVANVLFSSGRGERVVLPGHAPLCSAIAPGAFTYETIDHVQHTITIAEPGFLTFCEGRCDCWLA